MAGRDRRVPPSACPSSDSEGPVLNDIIIWGGGRAERTAFTLLEGNAKGSCAAAAAAAAAAASRGEIRTPDLLRLILRKTQSHEQLELGSPSTSLRWKFRWQSQAEHLRASRLPSSPLGMNSPHPSVAFPPIAAAWFF
eukprot:Gb_18046 [translate_table: standard]